MNIGKTLTKILLSADLLLFGIGCGNDELPKGNDLGEVLYKPIYVENVKNVDINGKIIDSLDVHYQEVVKVFVNGDTTAHYRQMEINLPDGEQINISLDAEGRVERGVNGLTRKEISEIYNSVNKAVRRKIAGVDYGKLVDSF